MFLFPKHNTVNDSITCTRNRQPKGTKWKNPVLLLKKRGWKTSLDILNITVIHQHKSDSSQQCAAAPWESILLTRAGSLDFPGVGLRGFGVEGASPVLEEPGSSFLRVGARSNPFPWGEWEGLPAGEFGSWTTNRDWKIIKRPVWNFPVSTLLLFQSCPQVHFTAFHHYDIILTVTFLSTCIVVFLHCTSCHLFTFLSFF